MKIYLEINYPVCSKHFSVFAKILLIINFLTRAIQVNIKLISRNENISCDTIPSAKNGRRKKLMGRYIAKPHPTSVNASINDAFFEKTV